MTSSLKVLATVIVNLSLALRLVSPLMLFSYLAGQHPVIEDIFWSSALLVAFTNIFDLALVSLFVLLAVMLLIHRVLWPLLTRTLFRLQDIGTKGRRAILTAVGLSLLSASVFGGKFPELVKDLIKTFGG